MNNLFISYDLISPGQRYDKVTEEIKKHGAWAKVHLSLFYVNSSQSAEQFAKNVWSVMDSNDKLIVIDATNNTSYFYNLEPDVANMIKDQWFK